MGCGTATSVLALANPIALRRRVEQAEPGIYCPGYPVRSLVGMALAKSI